MLSYQYCIAYETFSYCDTTLQFFTRLEETGAKKIKKREKYD